MGDSLSEEVYEFCTAAPGLFYMEEPDGFRMSFTENEQNNNEQQQQHQQQQQERTAQDIILNNIEAASLTEIYTRKSSMPPPKILTAHALHSSVLHSALYNNSNSNNNNDSSSIQNYTVEPLMQDVIFDTHHHHHRHSQGVFYPEEVFCVDVYAATNDLLRPGNIYVNRAQSAQLPRKPKRFPITVPTPRYYRKPCSASMVYKRPSALCFPIVAQPDPAATAHHPHHHNQQQQHRPAKRRDVEEPGIEVLEDGGKTAGITSGTGTSINVEMQKTDCGGDANATSIGKMTHLEKMLESFEYQARHGANSSIVDQTKIPKKHRLQVPKYSKLKTKFSPAMDKTSTNQQESRFKNLIEKLKAYDEQPKQENPQATVVEQKSFNYQDIADNLDRSKKESVSSQQEDEKSNVKMKKSKTSLGKKPSSYLFRKPTLTVRKSLDDMGAMELHHSKSYIVDLIDRALSKELGTVPNEVRQPSLYDMSPKKAIGCVNKYSSRFERPLCAELPPSILDYRLFRNADECLSNNPHQVDTPLIKQLKEMRWGHLRRIQKEVKDLENLERFLEFCYHNPCNE